MVAAYGAVLLLRGWYTLGENLSVDAELLHHQALCTSGPYRVVMHPVYAGIVHALAGAALALLSPLSAVVALCLVAPLFARRAKYEEALLTDAFGSAYTEYGERMGWHRFMPTFLSSAKR
jgi:protein-S-isoprenylcysteine O-methyltransferase